MYKINQFSKISGLTVKALRYYDQEGILQPAFRNEENQYRYYNDDNLKKAQLIKYLRSLDFSIMEIKDVVENVHSHDDLMYILNEKIKIIETNISKEKEFIKRMNTQLSTFHNKTCCNHYQIDTVTIDEILVASIHFRGQYTELDKYVPQLYKAVKNNKNGHHFNCYFDEECVESADIELCVPIKKEIDNKAIRCKILPQVKALRTTHYGSYETLYLAYQAMFEYVNTHHIETFTPSREIYIKGPGTIFKGNPDNYVTEILLPLETTKE